MYSRCMKILATLVAFLVASSFADKNASGKVRSRIGDVTLQKDGKGDWKDLRVGNKVYQGDYIRTLLESQAIIGLPDGSSFSIEENSVINLTEMVSDDGKNRITAEVKSGKIRFDVQKQHGSESHFKFKTGTALAAIRGTRGVFGLGKKGPMAMLSEGKMDLFMGKQAISITQNQAVITIGNRLVVIDLEEDTDPVILDKADSLASDTTLSEQDLIDKVKNISKQLSTDIKKLKESLRCEFQPLPDTVHESFATIKALCPSGVKVSIGGETFESNGSELTFTPNWAPNQEGNKKFTVLCSVRSVSYSCGNLNTYYHSSTPKDTTTTHQPLTLTTPSPLTVCDPASATIEGIFDNSDPNAILTVTHAGKTSENIFLSNPNGQLHYTLPIKDTRRNWNSERIVVEYSSIKFGKERVSIDLAVNKHCKAINTTAPKINVTATDSLRCFVKVYAEDLKGDQIYLSSFVDGVHNHDQYLSEKGSFSQEAIPGFHRYSFIAEDLAGNKSEVSRSAGCYPKTNATLELSGSSDIRLRVPPAPENFHKPLYQTIKFKIKGLPDNSTQHIKRILITQTGEKDVTFRTTDILSTTIEHQVKITRGQKSVIKITVYLKSGEILTATRTYKAF